MATSVGVCRHPSRLAQEGEHLRMRSEFSNYSITSTVTLRLRNDAVDPIAITNGIDSTQITVSSMKSLAYAMITACSVTIWSASMRPWSVARSSQRVTSGCVSASLNGLMCSESWLWNVVVL